MASKAGGMIIRSMRDSSEFKTATGSTDSPLSTRPIQTNQNKVRKGVGYLNSPKNRLAAKAKDIIAPSTFSKILSTEKIKPKPQFFAMSHLPTSLTMS